MKDQVKEGQLSQQQKYFLCFECCFWTFQLLVIALGLAVMGQVILGFSDTKIVLASKQYQHAEETVWLWKQGYIIDIRAENTNNCPEGYSPLISYEWPGTTMGCSCQSSSNGYSFNFVLLGRCSSNLIALGCEVVNSMGSETLNMWKGTSLLCYKRAQSMNFYNSILTTAPAGGISPTMATCSSNTPYRVQTLPGVTCPITAISNASLGGAQTKLTLDTTNDYFLNFIAETGYPIADVKLTEYQFCEFYNQTNISPNKQGRYILEQQSATTPCENTDPRVINVDQLDEEDFYTNNTRVYQLITSLPAYPKPSVDYKYTLGYIPYPSWTYSCRTTAQYDLYAATEHLLFENTSNSLNITASVTVPCMLVLVLLLRLYFIIRHVVDLKSRKTYNALMLTEDEITEQIPNLDIKKSFRKEFILFLLQGALMCGACGSIIYSIIGTTSDSTWIKQIVKYQCTDTYLQNIFLYYQHMIDQIATHLVTATFLWGTLFIAHILFFVIRNYIGDLYAKKEPVPEASSVSQEPLPLDILEKEGQLEGVNLQDSSQLVINKEATSELKIYDADFLMEGGPETKDNFYNLDREASINVVKKKKKKKAVGAGGKKKRNLFKDDQL